MTPSTNHAMAAPSEGWGRVAFRAGEATAIAGKPEESNPHPRGSVEAKNWLDGWRAYTARGGHS